MYCAYESAVIYTAATALIPARVYSFIRGNIPQSSLEQAWQRALKVLGGLVPLSSTASRCLAVLQLLNEECAPSDNAYDDTAAVITDFNGRKGGAVTVSANAPNFREPNPFSSTQTTTALPSLPNELAPGSQDMFGLSLAASQLQDFTWFDSLPTDLLAIDDAELFNLPM